MSNLYLIGFMGSGKTTVGRRLAERLGWPFTDTDEEIVRREGMEIPEIFSKGGEAFFRDLEQAVLLELSGRAGWVIATGGGIVVRGRNVEIMKESGRTVFLFAREEVLLGRLAEDEEVRPLLQGDSPSARIRQLLQERRGMYEWADLTVDTSDKSVDAVVGEILQHFGRADRNDRAV
ncbi:MAG: shikimate kinase [Kyrpidia sp.]|nr:shikimate kinase [Kyrpidia sp.]